MVAAAKKEVTLAFNKGRAVQKSEERISTEDPCSGSYFLQGEKKARDKMVRQQRSGMPSGSWGTKGQKAARASVFIEHIHSEENGEIMA